MSAIIIRNEIVHYEVLGRGRPIVFLHGWVGSWRDWIQTMQAAAASYRCYAIDLWGFGDTAKSETRYSLKEQSDLIADFIDALGIGKIALVGHGLGALVAARFALNRPQSADRLLLFGLPLGGQRINERIRKTAVEDLSSWLHNGLTGSEGLKREAVKADRQAILRSLQNLEALNPQYLLAEIKIPCLFVHAEKDLLIAPPEPAVMAGMNALSHHIVLNNTGHYSMVSDAGKFSRLVSDFLSLESGESPRNLQLKDEWKRRFR